MKTIYSLWKNWKNVFFLFLFYLSAHFLLLFSKVIMWDGWLWTGLLKQKNYEMLFQLFSQAKILHTYVIYRAIDSLGNPVAISNILVFASWFIAGTCVYFILKDFTRIGEKNAFFVAVLFLLSPIFIVRFQIALISYSLSNAAFFLGSYVFLRAGAAARILPKIVLKILATILFISAFFTPSFLVFYGALILFTFATKVSKWRMDNIYIFLKKNIFWILLPFIFYLAHQKFIGEPYGLYKGYNSFVFSPSILIDRAYQFVAYGFFGPIIFSISVLQRKIFLAIFLVFLTCIFFFERRFNVLSALDKDDSNKANAAPKNIFIWGTLLFIFGSVAYILVGESPSPYGSGFDMRHGLILPLGASLIIFALINGLLKHKIWGAAKIIILAVFITYNIYNYYTVDMDWYKQIGIIESIREKHSQDQVGEKDIFVFYDKIPLYLWRDRSIRAHEYTGYLYEATGNQKLMGSDADGNLRFISAIKNDNFTDGKSPVERFKNIVIASDSNQEPSVKNWIKLKAADLFLGKDKLRSLVKSIIGVNAQISVQTPP